MTDLVKPVTRRTRAEHSRHRRRIVVTLMPGDVIGFRLERHRGSDFTLPIESLYDQAERKHAEAITGFDAGPRSLRRR